MIISSFFPIIGGAERQAQQLSASLIKRGLQVCVLTRRYQGLNRYDEIDGIPVHRVPAFGPRPVAAMLFTLSSLVWLFLNRHSYQIVHCHQVLSPTIIGALAKLFWKKKLVVKVTGTGQAGGIAQINAMPLSSLRRKLLRQVDRFIYLNNAVYEELRGFGFSDVAITLPNGVDTDKLRPVTEEVKNALRENLGLPTTCRLVIFTGRLNSLKRLDILLKSWADIVGSPESPACHLLILGEGEERVSLNGLARQLDIEKHLSFLGRKENVSAYLQASDIFVLPSETEGISNSLLEAMACGLAVVATKVGGTGEILVHQRDGFLVEPRSQSQLAKGLLRLLQDQVLAQRLGAEARKTVEARYSLNYVTEQYVRLYASLLAQN